jgi:lipopolysaccharide export system protein LptC
LKKSSLVLLILSTAVSCFIAYLLLVALADPPEFAQDSDKPKAYRHWHSTNKWRELAWWILNPHGEQNYDVLPRTGGFSNAWKRCFSQSD